MLSDNQTPPDWVLREAAKRSNFIHTPDFMRKNYGDMSSAFRALCDMIAKHEQPPVDRKLLCAREAVRVVMFPEKVETTCVRAIELWDEGFGK